MWRRERDSDTHRLQIHSRFLKLFQKSILSIRTIRRKAEDCTRNTHAERTGQRDVPGSPGCSLYPLREHQHVSVWIHNVELDLPVVLPRETEPDGDVGPARGVRLDCLELSAQLSGRHHRADRRTFTDIFVCRLPSDDNPSTPPAKLQNSIA
jgi:hypothetical protein